MERVIGERGGDGGAAGLVGRGRYFCEDVAVGIVGVRDCAGLGILRREELAEGIVGEAANAPGAGRVIARGAGAAGLPRGVAVLLDAGEVVADVVEIESDVGRGGRFARREGWDCIRAAVE